MPSVSLSAGETKELLTLKRFQAVSINPDGGDIRVDDTERWVKSAEVTKDGDRTIKWALHPNETFYVYAESDVTVDFRIQGFLDIYFQRESIDTYQRSADTVKEANADQTQNVSADQTVTSTIRAGAGEVWRLRELRIEAAGTGTASGTQSHQIEIVTEAEAVEVGFAEYEEDADIDYLSGDWRGTSITARGITTGVRVDEDNGLDFNYTANGEDQTNDRIIRGVFDVVRRS